MGDLFEKLEHLGFRVPECIRGTRVYSGYEGISGIRGYRGTRVYPGYEVISGVRGYIQGTRVYPGYEGTMRYNVC